MLNAEDSIDTLIDPVGPSVGSNRVLRGGNWGNLMKGVRISYRFYYVPNLRYSGNGFYLGYFN